MACYRAVTTLTTGIRCFKHSGSVPDVETTPYRCTGIGQYVTVYNDRFRNTSYGPNYNTDGAVLELCEVEVSDNLALRKQAEQSSSLFEGSAAKGNDGNHNNNEEYSVNSCIHTAQEEEESWWRVDLGFITKIHEVKITYRDKYAQRFAGFSIFVSNTTHFKTGIRCFKQNGSLPSVATTSYPCTTMGQFVTVYNDRFHNTTYPSDYNTGGAILELCDVEVPGCYPQRYGQDCGKSCFCKVITCDYKTGQCDGDCRPGYTGEACNTSCVLGYFGDKCLSQCPHCGGAKTCNQSGVCTNGCEAGYFPGESPGCPQVCGNCVGVACNSDGACPYGCKDGYYLLTCNGLCPNTCNNKTCERHSGNCLSCNVGYYGSRCGQTCPDNCLNERCDMYTGNCVACEPWFYGKACLSECPHCGGTKTCNQSGVCLDGCEVGFYHDDSKICSKQCGQCIGTRCNLDGRCPQRCVDGYYLFGCTARCPNNCNNRTCKRDSGKCFACSDGYFDEHCDRECPQQCLQGKCDHSSGHCFAETTETCDESGSRLNGCDTGYVCGRYPGYRLKKMTSNLTLPLAIGISSGIFLALLNIITIVIWKRRKRAHTTARSQIYMETVDGHPTEHVYSDINPGIQNTNPLALEEELEDINSRDAQQKTKVADVKTE